MDMASFRKAILQQVLQPPVHQSLCSLMCFCNPPLLAGPSCWKLIQARSASLELMFRCRLAFLGRQWPKTFIDLTVAIPGSNLHPAACHHHGPRCYPANHVLEAVPGARAVVALLFQPPSTPMHQPAWLLWSGSSMPCLRLAWLPCHVSRPLGFRDGRESGEMTPSCVVWCAESPTPARNQLPPLPPYCPHFLDVVPRPSR